MICKFHFFLPRGRINITNYLMNDYMYIAANYYFYSIFDNNLHFILLYLYFEVSLILSMM